MSAESLGVSNEGRVLNSAAPIPVETSPCLLGHQSQGGFMDREDGGDTWPGSNAEQAISAPWLKEGSRKPAAGRGVCV